MDFKSPQRYSVDSTIDYPVMVKPNVSAGSKGVTIAYDRDKLMESVKIASAISQDHQVIIEEYIESDYFSSDSDFFSIDGKLVLARMNNQLFDSNAPNRFVPAGFTWPTMMPNDKQEECKREVQRLIDLLHLGTSIYNIEARIGKNGKVYLMEVSPRGGGNRLAECQDRFFGSTLIKNSVRSAVNMPLLDFTEDERNRYFAEIILHSSKSGRFRKLSINRSVEKNIEEIDLWVSDGDMVEEFIGANKMIGTVILQFDTQEELDEFQKKRDELIKVELYVD